MNADRTGATRTPVDSTPTEVRDLVLTAIHVMCFTNYKSLEGSIPPQLVVSTAPPSGPGELGPFVGLAETSGNDAQEMP